MQKLPPFGCGAQFAGGGKSPASVAMALRFRLTLTGPHAVS
jgi:hypothetical protein